MQNRSDRPRCALRARCVFPGAGKPLRDAAVTIAGSQIVAVGAPDRAAEVLDLGNVAILPGLVNAHTHLEFSDLAAPLGRPGMGMVDWIREVIALRRRVAGAPRDPVRLGLQESLRLGTTAMGEIAQPGWNAAPFQEVDLEAVVFLELIAPVHDRMAPALEAANRAAVAELPPGCFGLSPHAPYSVIPSVFQALAEICGRRRMPMAFHLAESREEMEFLRTGTGPFCEFLSAIPGWNPADFRLGARPLDYLRTATAADRVLVIHGNYFDDEEIAFLAAHADRMSVVYCPRTHAYFGHAPYPLAKMLAAGVSVALGTDSRASSPDLSVLSEMRHVARRRPAVDPGTVLALGTICAARALGRDREVGSLEPGKSADLAVVSLPGHAAADPYELLFASDQPVAAVWRRGRRVSCSCRSSPGL